MNQYTPTIKRKAFAVLFLWSLIVFMPGSYSVDSYNYVYQFTHNLYSDWHPPLLAFVWKVLFRMTGYYEALYAVQMALYWYMGYILTCRIATSKMAFGVGVGLLLLFQFLPQYVMKDTHAALSWGMAALLMVGQMRAPNTFNRKAVNIIIILLLAYGLVVRVNAVVAIIPLLAAYLFVIAPPIQSFAKKAMVIAGIIAALLFVNNVLTYRVFRATKTYPQYKLMLLDITGISKKSGTDYFPAEITGYPYFDRNRLMQLYTAASFDHIYWPESTATPIVPMPTAAIANSVSEAWRTAIAAHPLLYLQNRLDGFLYYLRIRHRLPREAYWNVKMGIEKENPINVCKPYKSHSSRFSMGAFTNTFFFDPWFWLLLNVLLAAYFYRKYRKEQYIEYKLMALVQLSGVLYTLSQFPIYQHDQDFRYNYWNLIVFLIGFVYMIGKPILARNPNEV